MSRQEGLGWEGGDFDRDVATMARHATEEALIFPETCVEVMVGASRQPLPLQVILSFYLRVDVAANVECDQVHDHQQREAESKVSLQEGWQGIQIFGRHYAVRRQRHAQREQHGQGDEEREAGDLVDERGMQLVTQVEKAVDVLESHSVSEG